MEQNISDVEDGKIYAFLAYLLTIVGFIIVMLTKKDNKFAMYHAKQGLVLFIAAVVVSVLGTVLGFIGLPFIGFGFGWIAGILNLGLFILWIIGMVNALSGQEKPLPVLGEFAKKISL